MPITLPVTGAPISTTAFGIPVARALNNLVPLEARATGDLTLAVGYVLVPGATLTFTPTVTELVLAWAQFDFDGTVAGYGSCQGGIYVNGVARPGSCTWNPNPAGQIARTMQQFMGITAAGAGVAQTFEARAQKSTGAGTAIARTTHSRLLLIRVPQ